MRAHATSSAATRPAPGDPALESLGRGGFVRLAYRLGRARATGVLTVRHGDHRELLVLRRGYVMTAESDALGRQAAQRLARLAGAADARVHFDGGTAAYPPGAIQRQLPLAVWARRHLESQVDAGRARDLLHQLAGARLSVRPELSPNPATCDATDLRMLEAMREPRRLDQIWPLARTPRFRLLAFLHFLAETGALSTDGIAARPLAPSPRARAAHELLGISAGADHVAVRRAYRRLARALHPDLHPDASVERRRALERKLADVTDAYRQLCPAP